MTQVRARSGHVLTVADEAQAEFWTSRGYSLVKDSAGAPSSSYSSLKVDDLRAAIDARNEGRDEADLIPSDGKKADLIAALEADDNN